jgi:putative DNA primase/helicase
MPSPEDTALALALMGIPVFGCAVSKAPAIPRSEGGKGHLDATTDPAAIVRMFADPRAVLIGVPTGSVSGFDALDIDRDSGGLEWWDQHKSELPRTRVHHTRSGGLHYLFKHAEGIRSSAGQVARGVDVRGDGGYIIWYETPSDIWTWADWPAWLLPAALPRTRLGSASTVNLDELAPPSAADLLTLLMSMPNPAETSRDDYVAVNLAVVGCLRALDDPDSESDIMDAAAEWSARWDSPRAASFQAERDRWDNDWLLRDHDVSGWRHVLGHAARLGVDVSAYRIADAQAEFQAVALPRDAAPVTEPAAPPARFEGPEELTETDVADVFARIHAGRIVYDRTSQTWAVYGAGVWARDRTDLVLRMVQNYVNQCRAAFGGEKSAGSAGFVSGVERLARNVPCVSIDATRWDTDPMLLGVPGGVVDLRTGAMGRGSPELYVSKQTTVAPAPPGTPTPQYDSFLMSSTAGSSDYAAWLMKVQGYYITGDVKEETFVIFYGATGTGKGTFINVFSNIAGDYCYQVPVDFFDSKSRSNPEYQRAKIAGRRAVLASEPESGSALAEGLIKELTGNEGKVNAREPYGKPFEYRSQAKYLIASNHAPKIRGRSGEMERRIRIAPFENKPAVVNRGLKVALEAEYPGILRKIIDGCLAWQSDGQGMCGPVARATGAYFDEQDGIGHWIDDRFDMVPGHGVSRIALRTNYAAWSHEAGERPLQPRELYEALRRRPGLTDEIIKGSRCFVGLKPKDVVRATEFEPIDETKSADIIELFK